VLLHLGLTSELTSREKRVWIRALASARSASAFSAYASSPNRRASARRLAAAAKVRRSTNA
jgi:hypothetical protein